MTMYFFDNETIAIGRVKFSPRECVLSLSRDPLSGEESCDATKTLRGFLERHSEGSAQSLVETAGAAIVLAQAETAIASGVRHEQKNGTVCPLQPPAYQS